MRVNKPSSKNKPPINSMPDVNGVKKVGKWVVEKDQLCLYLQEPDDGCYEVSLSGNTIAMKPMGLGGTLDGIIQPPTDNR